MPWVRNERGAVAGLKTISYAENVRALAYADEHGAGEAMFPNTRGELCEATGSNVFIVRDGTVVALLRRRRAACSASRARSCSSCAASSVSSARRSTLAGRRPRRRPTRRSSRRQCARCSRSPPSTGTRSLRRTRRRSPDTRRRLHRPRRQRPRPLIREPPRRVRPSAGGRRRRRDHVRRRRRRVATTSSPASTDVDSDADDRGHRTARRGTRRPSVASRARYVAGHRRRVRRAACPSRSRYCVEDGVAVDGRAGFEVARGRDAPRARAGTSSTARCTPAPTTTVPAARPVPGSCSASSPASLRSPTTRSLGHLSSGVNPATSTAPHRPARAPPPSTHQVRAARAPTPGGAAPTPGATSPAAPPTCGRDGPGPRSGGRRPRPRPRARRAVPRRAGSDSWSRAPRNGGSSRSESVPAPP